MGKKGFIYVLFFMVGFMISIVIVDSMKIEMKYAWIPFVSSIVITTILICYVVEDVRLHEVVLSAVASVVLSFTIGVFGAISGALLLFQGVSAGLGFAATSVAGLAASLGLLSAAAVPTVIVAAGIADPPSLAEAARIPLPNSPPGSPARSRASTGETDWDILHSGGRRKRGGLRWRW